MSVKLQAGALALAAVAISAAFAPLLHAQLTANIALAEESESLSLGVLRLMRFLLFNPLGWLLDVGAVLTAFGILRR